MNKRKQKTDEAELVSQEDDLAIVDTPVDTDDNNERDADASGDSDDETQDENEASKAWQRGEK